MLFYATALEWDPVRLWPVCAVFSGSHVCVCVVCVRARAVFITGWMVPSDPCSVWGLLLQPLQCCYGCSVDPFCHDPWVLQLQCA